MHVFSQRVLRSLVIIINIAGFAAIDSNRTDIDWIACVLVGLLFSACVLLSLSLSQSNHSINGTTPFSWDIPFLPMQTHPISFWHIISLSLIWAGIFKCTFCYLLHPVHFVFGVSVLFWGVSILVTLKIWLRYVGYNRH